MSVKRYIEGGYLEWSPDKESNPKTMKIDPKREFIDGCRWVYFTLKDRPFLFMFILALLCLWLRNSVL